MERDYTEQLSNISMPNVMPNNFLLGNRNLLNIQYLILGTIKYNPIDICFGLSPIKCLHRKNSILQSAVSLNILGLQSCTSSPYTSDLINGT